MLYKNSEIPVQEEKNRGVEACCTRGGGALPHHAHRQTPSLTSSPFPPEFSIVKPHPGQAREMQGLEGV